LGRNERGKFSELRGIYGIKHEKLTNFGIVKKGENCESKYTLSRGCKIKKTVSILG